MDFTYVMFVGRSETLADYGYVALQLYKYLQVLISATTGVAVSAL